MPLNDYLQDHHTGRTHHESSNKLSEGSTRALEVFRALGVASDRFELWLQPALFSRVVSNVQLQFRGVVHLSWCW